MGKLPAAAIDPYLLILPDPCHSVDQLIFFVKGLLGWSEALSRPEADFFISDMCILSLYNDGWYPYTGRIQRLVQNYGQKGEFDFVDEQTLIQVAQKVIDRTPRLEERIGIEVVVFNNVDKQVRVEPSSVVERLGTHTATALKETLAMLGMGRSFLPTLPDGCVFASTAGNEREQIAELSIDATIEDAELTDDTPVELAFPLTFSDSLHVCLGHNDYIRQIDALTHLGNGDSVSGLRDAILAMSLNLLEEGLPTLNTPASYTAGLKTENGLIRYRLGPQFLNSLHQWGFNRRQDWAMVLIESCARILLGIPKNEIKAFRVSEKSSEQRYSDTKRGFAWRTHLTKANEGFRLMIWTTEDGVIEFANVGPKKELYIED